jgi:hypothetical protein
MFEWFKGNPREVQSFSNAIGGYAADLAKWHEFYLIARIINGVKRSLLDGFDNYLP